MKELTDQVRKFDSEASIEEITVSNNEKRYMETSGTAVSMDSICLGRGEYRGAAGSSIGLQNGKKTAYSRPLSNAGRSCRSTYTSGHRGVL